MKDPAGPDLEGFHALVVAVYQQARFRCGNPTCGQWVVIDANHLVYVTDGGGDTLENLLPLCPSCYRRNLRGQFEDRAIPAWKSVLCARDSPYDLDSFTFMSFLGMLGEPLVVNTDQLLTLTREVASGAIKVNRVDDPEEQWWALELSVRGHLLLEAWRQGQPIGDE